MWNLREEVYLESLSGGAVRGLPPLAVRPVHHKVLRQSLRRGEPAASPHHAAAVQSGGVRVVM